MAPAGQKVTRVDANGKYYVAEGAPGHFFQS
jgi:hypothetical protein